MFDDLVNSLQQLSDVLQAQRTLGVALASIAEAATVSVPGCDAATIAISIGGRPATAAVTGTIGLELDMVQYDNDDGPCLTSFRTASALRLDVYEHGEAFPHVAIAAQRVGVRAVMSVPSIWGTERSRRSTFTAAAARSTRAPRPSPPCSPHRSPSRSADPPSSQQPAPWWKKPSATPTTTRRSRWRPGCSSAARTAPANKPKDSSGKPPPRTSRRSCRSLNASSNSTATHADSDRGAGSRRPTRSGSQPQVQLMRGSGAWPSTAGCWRWAGFVGTAVRMVG